MSVTKNWDTNLRYRERKTLRNFLSLYFFLCLCILLLLGVSYYKSQKEIMLQNAAIKLKQCANEQIKALRHLHVNLHKNKVYPRFKDFKSAIYDSDKKEIFSLLSEKPNLSSLVYENNGKVFYSRELESYYLGAKYLVLELEDDKKWLFEMYSVFLWIGGLLVLIFFVFGYFLSRLFLRPMKDAILLLDRFIKDTTHELNTPISTILSNIELIDENTLEEKTKTKLRRINIAALTVSNLYQDLLYLTLGQRIVSHMEKVNLKDLFEERLEYFSIVIKSKNLLLTSKLTNSFLLVDKAKITKLIDNLISNAIKYNKKNGILEVEVENKYFCISNEGKSIEKNKISSMFERYTRGENQVGGFGIGLHIVSVIAKEYNLKIEVKKYKKEGTCVKVSW